MQLTWPTNSRRSRHGKPHLSLSGAAMLCCYIVTWDRWQKLPHTISLLNSRLYTGIIHHSFIFFPVSHFIIFPHFSAPSSVISSPFRIKFVLATGSIAEMSFASAENLNDLNGRHHTWFPPGLAAHGRRHPGHRLRTGMEHTKIHNKIPKILYIMIHQNGRVAMDVKTSFWKTLGKTPITFL